MPRILPSHREILNSYLQAFNEGNAPDVLVWLSRRYNMNSQQIDRFLVWCEENGEL